MLRLGEFSRLLLSLSKHLAQVQRVCVSSSYLLAVISYHECRHVLSAKVGQTIGPNSGIQAVPAARDRLNAPIAPPIARAIRKALHHEVIRLEVCSKHFKFESPLNITVVLPQYYSTVHPQLSRLVHFKNLIYSRKLCCGNPKITGLISPSPVTSQLRRVFIYRPKKLDIFFIFSSSLLPYTVKNQESSLSPPPQRFISSNICVDVG